jgi:hypothetical protein
MTWFKVDDGFHSHPKTAAASLAAIGLWAVAGSWASDHLTDGEVPEHMVASLARGEHALADELVQAGLWRRVKAGYRFHQWTQDSDGTKRNPSRKEVEEERRKKADAGRKGGLSSAKTRSATQAGAQAAASRLVQPPTRPDPTQEEQVLFAASKTSAPKPEGRRGTRLPDDFDVTEDMKGWARKNTPTAGPTDHAAFVDYWRSQPGTKGTKLDWVATWRNWMRKAHADNQRRGGRPRATPPRNGIVPPWEA